MIILGLTGSIGTGKSTTARIFRSFGIPVYDADRAVHELYNNAAHTPIADAFPNLIHDGKMDKSALKTLIAQDKTLLSKLENIIHPLVQDTEKKLRKDAQLRGHRLMVLDVPLLFETGGDKRCDIILVTHVNDAEQKRRVLTRAGMTEADFYRLLKRQMPQLEKRRRAHTALDTSIGFEKAKHEIEALIRCLGGVIRNLKSH